MGLFDSLANAIKELTKTIEDNQNNLSDRLQQKALEQKVASGELTEEQAFDKWVELSKGDMISCFCTHCGNRISLHEKIDNGFCEFCGELVTVQEALRGNFSDIAIENIDGKDLFAIATSKSTVNMELVKHAAKKSDVNANRLLAYNCVQDGDYEAAYDYAKVGADKTDADSKVYLMLSAVCTQRKDAKKALSELKCISPDNLHTEEAKKVRIVAIEMITEQLARQERERRRAEEEERLRRQAILNSITLPSTPVETPDPGNQHGPLATAKNCGMPYIDVSDM